MDLEARLLELQRIDLDVDRLDARRSDLEAGTELAAARGEADAAEGELGEHRLRTASMERDGGTLEHEIDSLRQRAAAEERRMYDGSIANAKELSSLQHEIANLAKRIADREDELLAIMEQREDVDRLAAAAATRTEVLRERAAEVAAVREQELRDVGATLEELRGTREGLAAEIESDVLELYQDLRRQKKGLAVAALVDGVCQGCHEQLSAMELDRLGRTAGLGRCEHCRRILVPDAG